MLRLGLRGSFSHFHWSLAAGLRWRTTKGRGGRLCSYGEAPNWGPQVGRSQATGRAVSGHRGMHQTHCVLHTLCVGRGVSGKPAGLQAPTIWGPSNDDKAAAGGQTPRRPSLDSQPQARL